MFNLKLSFFEKKVPIKYMHVVMLLDSICCGEESVNNTYAHCTNTIKRSPHAYPNL